MWEFRYREEGTSGRIVRRTVIIGTIDQYPTKELASAAANGLRMRINQTWYRQRGQSLSVGDLIDHFMQTQGHRYKQSTKKSYCYALKIWVCPRWATTNIHDVHTTDVEEWLGNLCRKDGKPLADGTKAKIRNTMNVTFSHAIRCEWFQSENPITKVRQSGASKKKPTVLAADEINRLLDELNRPHRLMVHLDVTTGLRGCELFALQWDDFDFDELTMSVSRGVVDGVIGSCKTRFSNRVVPIDPELAMELKAWRKLTAYSAGSDWVFASPHSKGKQPFCRRRILRKHIRPALIRAGIEEHVGWHTFRHTFSSLLHGNKERTKAIQEMMGHATYRMTHETYIWANFEHKAEAVRNLVQMIQSAKPKPHDNLSYTPKMSASLAAECDALTEEQMTM